MECDVSLWPKQKSKFRTHKTFFIEKKFNLLKTKIKKYILKGGKNIRNYENFSAQDVDIYSENTRQIGQIINSFKNMHEGRIIQYSENNICRNQS